MDHPPSSLFSGSHVRTHIHKLTSVGGGRDTFPSWLECGVNLHIMGDYSVKENEGTKYSEEKNNDDCKAIRKSIKVSNTNKDDSEYKINNFD